MSLTIFFIARRRKKNEGVIDSGKPLEHKSSRAAIVAPEDSRSVAVAVVAFLK